MTQEEKEELIITLEKQIQECLDSIPDDILKQEPRFVLSGEIIPEIFRADMDTINYKFEIKSKNNKHISLTPFIPKHIDSIAEDGTRHVIPFDSDGNQVEIFCHQSEGWDYYQEKYRGHFISTTDIKSMADCIRSVISKEKDSAEYVCHNHFIRIEIAYDHKSYKYSFMIAVLDISNCNHYISVTRKGLSRKELDPYIFPFLKWEEMFPITNKNN